MSLFYSQVQTHLLKVGSVTYAYRELGPKGGIPVVFFVHLAATLDNWDPRIVDAVAHNRHVIAFDQPGVGGSTGKVPDTIEAMADDAYRFIQALGYEQIDIFAFSMGGFIAQDLVLRAFDRITAPGKNKPGASILPNALSKFTRSTRLTDGQQHAIFMANALSILLWSENWC